jgi:hypothetical protein
MSQASGVGVEREDRERKEGKTGGESHPIPVAPPVEAHY